jgi:hypothetical protein
MQLKEKNFDINFASPSSILISKGIIKEENFIDECFVSLNNIKKENENINEDVKEKIKVEEINDVFKLEVKKEFSDNNKNDYKSDFDFDFEKNSNLKTGKILLYFLYFFACFILYFI